MSLTRPPLVVRKPVLVTSANTGSSGIVYLLYTTSVPPNKECLPAVSVEYFFRSFRGSDVFMTGTLSPVSIASLTIAVPVKSMRSHGRLLPSGTITISPGRSSELSTSVKVGLPSLSDNLTVIGQVYWAILRIFSLLRMFSQISAVTLIVEIVKIVKA